MAHININGQSLSPEQVANLLPRLPDGMRSAIASKLDLNQKIQVLRHELRRECLERELQIDALLALLVAKQHGILLGPPGTGKTFLIELICKTIDGAQFFSEQMSEFHKPENLFGALSPKKLMEDGEFVRNTNRKLSQATIAYLDEIWKGSTPLMNMLLAILNERVFYNPDPQKIPLRTLIGSSNELPEDNSSNALLDRFVYKQWVGYLEDDSSINTLWDRLDRGIKSQIFTRLTLDELDAATIAASQIKISHLHPLLLNIKKRMESAGYKAQAGALLSDKQQVSDRKWPQIFGFLKAIAFVNGESEVTTGIIGEYLVDCLWFAPHQRDEIQGIINQAINDYTGMPKHLLEQAMEHAQTFEDWVETTGDLSGIQSRSIGCLTKLDGFIEQLGNCKNNGCLADLCDGAIAQIETKKELIRQLTIENSLSPEEQNALELVKKNEKLIIDWERDKPDLTSPIQSMTAMEREQKLSQLSDYADRTEKVHNSLKSAKHNIENSLNGKSPKYVSSLTELWNRFNPQAKQLAEFAAKLDELLEG